MTKGREPQSGQGIGQPDFVWLRGLAEGNNRFTRPSVTALSGGGQPGAIEVGAVSELVEVRTVAVADDSCLLPQAINGKVIKVFNSSANSTNIYASPVVNKATAALDTINGNTNVTAYALAGGKSVEFFCPRDGIWAALLSA